VDEFVDSFERNGFDLIHLKRKYLKNFPRFFGVAVKI